jgi:hypothetical protein
VWIIFFIINNICLIQYYLITIFDNIYLIPIIFTMGKTTYSRLPPSATKFAKTSARDLRIHYKNTY